MKFLYVAPRFHTNQVPIVEGLIEKGHEVRFAVMRLGANEKHSGATVDVLEPSLIAAAIKKHYSKKGVDAEERAMITWFSPKRKQLKALLQAYAPDVIIMRDRNMFTLRAYRMAKRHGVSKCILYNQSPIYFEKRFDFKSVIKNILFKFFPKERITTCRYSAYPKAETEYVEDKNAHFLHFIPRKFVGERIRSTAGALKILDIGKYRPYKNHYVLVDAAAILLERGVTSFEISVYGQNIADEEQKYFRGLVKYSEEKGLRDFVKFNGGVPYDSVCDLMLENDVFVLTSKRELANISIIDAIAFGTVPVATNLNGTSDYINDGVTGMIYSSNDPTDLADKLEILIKNRVLLHQMSKVGMCDMRDNYNFESYYQKLMSLLAD